MAKKRSLRFYLFATVLTCTIHLCFLIPRNESTEDTSQKDFAARKQCLSVCGLDKEYAKTRSWSRSPQNQKDSKCYQDCIKSTMEGYQQSTKGKKRSTTVETKYECPVVMKTVERKLGDIQNLSVAFVQQRRNDGNKTWIANVTWDVLLLDESYYFSDEWSGFLIVWLNTIKQNSPSSTENYCRFNSKNQTNLVIKSGSTEWVYPDAIDVGVSLYPSTKNVHENGFDLITFDPGASGQTTKASGQTTKESRQIASSSPLPPPAKSPFLAILFGCFSGLIIVGVVAYSTWKKLPRTPNPIDPENYEYDAAILFSTEDVKWVTTELIPLLELQNKFKCFIFYRDFEVGRVLHEVMADAVYKCRKNVAIVSKNFLSSNYCKEELHMALERVQRLGDNSLIVLNLDGVLVDLLPRALRTRIFVNLTNSQERNTWKTRLVKQISLEGKNAPKPPNNPEPSCVRITNQTGMPVVHEGTQRPNESVV